MDGRMGLSEARATLVELTAATAEALELMELIELRRRGGEPADDDEAMLRGSLRAMGEALIALAGRAS
jgi:hypothetical protein